MKYKIELTTMPSSNKKFDEENKKVFDKLLDSMLDELILNGHLEIGD